MEIAARLKDNLRTTDSISTLADGTTVSRLGRDQFVVILDDVECPESACLAASRLINALNEQYQLGDRQVRSTASIGIVCSDSRYERAEAMVRDADTAMYEAKARGKACYVVFDDSMHEAAQRRLKSGDDLLLFEFVDRICAAVGSSRPRRIDIDCNINASAGFGRGLMSMAGSDLVLTIGMPLVAGLTMQQFAGVLATEFGHFTQGAGMRLTYLIRSISMWFTRVVYERDAWDERLDR